jgi:hypothetical protein
MFCLIGHFNYINALIKINYLSDFYESELTLID